MSLINTEIFKYRKAIITLYKISYWGLVVICLILARLNIVQIAEGIWYEALIKGLLAISVPFSILIRFHFIVRPRIFASYVLGDSKLIMRFKNKVKEIEFDKIELVKFSWLSPRFFGGFGLTLKTGQKFVFLSVLENNHLILEKVAVARPELVSADRLRKYIRISKLVEVSWGRILSRMKMWPAMAFKFILYPFILAFILYSQKIGFFVEKLTSVEIVMYNFVYVSTVSLLILLFINHFEEVFLNSKVTESPGGHLQVDLIWENRIRYFTQIIFYVLTLSLVLIISAS